jgi:hypothetical protein
VGLPLYFIFVRTMVIVTFLMSLLSVPTLLFSFFGHRIPEEDRDFIGLYRLAIGNIGDNPDSRSYEDDSACSHNAHLKCVSVLSIEFTLQAVANIIMVSEILQVLIFLVAVRYLVLKTRVARGKIGSRTCHVSDYSIEVQGIPADSTVEQLLEHFSGLYYLDKKDWRGRPALEEAEAVQVTHNTGNPIYKGTWVAEVTIFTRIGSMIKAFKNKKRLMNDLLRYRAQMKMYADNTSHAGGPNPRRFRYCCVSLCLEL